MFMNVKQFDFMELGGVFYGVHQDVHHFLVHVLCWLQEYDIDEDGNLEGIVFEACDK
jgi:hypothetical protein